MVLPNFICLGVGKAGTTSLHYLLGQHPDVLLVPEKEANYFNDEESFAKGPEWYAEKFAAHSGQRFVGDITPSYFFTPVTFQRIADCCGPDVKLIVLFRQPARRAFSHYLHHVRVFETNKSFAYDLEENEDDRLRVASTYSERLAMLLDIFPRKNVLTLIYERHVASGKLPVGYLQIAKHLGLGVHPMNFNVHMGKALIPTLSFIENAEDAARFPSLEGIAPGDIVIETVRDSDAGFVPELVKSPDAATMKFYRDFEANITRSLSEEQVRDITERLFAEDIACLKDMLRDPIPE